MWGRGPGDWPECPEVWILFARMFSMGLLLGLAVLASLGILPMSSAQAAYPSWSGYASPQKQPQFRPWSRADSKSVSVHRQQQLRASTSRKTPGFERRRPPAMPSHRKGQQPIFSGTRAGARKAVPITRGQDLGLRFRPDERDSPYGQAVTPPSAGGSDAFSSELHSQFRPTRSKRKPTYEELQAGDAYASPQQMMPAMPYPMMPTPPLPGYGSGRAWPNW